MLRYFVRPKGAAPCQPRPTAWVPECTGHAKPQRGDPISRFHGPSSALLPRHRIRAAPSGLESDMGGWHPRAALRLPWADIGLPLWGGRKRFIGLSPMRTVQELTSASEYSSASYSRLRFTHCVMHSVANSPACE